MKFIPTFFLFVCFNSFCQEAFILKNDGSKFFIDNNSVKVVASEKNILYKLPDNSSEKTIDFRDFQVVVYGRYKFITLKVNGSKNIEGFFVLADVNEKKLVSIQVIDPESESEIEKFIFHVLDKDNMITESHVFSNQENAKQNNLRSEIYSKIKNYFPECQALIQRLATFDNFDNDGKNLSIIKFFKTPIFISCR